MAGKEKFTAKQMVEALKSTRGFVSLAASRLKCSVRTVQNYVERYPSVKQAKEEAREMMIDIAEGKLYEQIQQDNMTAIIFFLKCQGKKRGYTERQEVTGAEGNPLEVVVKGYSVVSPDDWPDKKDNASSE